MRLVAATAHLFDETTVRFLEQSGCTVRLADLPPGKNEGDLSPEQLLEVLSGAAGWIVGPQARVTRPLLEALPGLKVVARRGVGYDRVDLAAAKELGRVVAIAPGGNDASVADHAIGLMLAIAKRFGESQANMRAGKWSVLMGSDLFQKTVGIVGLGRIGRGLARRLGGFDARVLVHTPRPDADFARATGIEYVPLDELLRRSDFVSIHAPLTPETRFLIDEKAIARMKRGAVLINTARGGLVHDGDLLQALKTGQLAGAGLDVFVSESDPAFMPVTNALLALPNVVATPHAGASSKEGLERTNMIAAKAIIAILDGLELPPGSIVADGRPGAAG